MNIIHCYHHETSDELAFPAPDYVRAGATYKITSAKMTVTVRSILALGVGSDRIKAAVGLYQSRIDRSVVASKIDWMISLAKEAKEIRDTGQEDFFG